MLYGGILELGMASVLCDLGIASVVSSCSVSLGTELFCVMIPLVTCVCLVTSSAKSMLSYTRLIYALGTNSLGTLFDVLIVS